MKPITKIGVWVLVLGLLAYNRERILGALDEIAKWYNSPSTPAKKATVEQEVEPTNSTSSQMVFVPDMHEFTLQPGGPTITVPTNGRPFRWDGSNGKWLVQIQNRKGVNMSPSGRIDGWDIDYPGNNIGIPSDVRSISFCLPKRDGLLLTLPVHVVVWYTD